MTKPTFFIVTPSYNQGQFLKRALDSIVEQTGFSVISIVQDGGSSDNSLSVLKDYGKRVLWVSHKDKGQSDALNQGLKKVLKMSKHPESDIFAYLNSDDYYLPNTFVKVAEAFASKPKAVWLVGDCQIVNEHDRAIQQPVRAYKSIWRKILSWPILLILNPIPQPAVFIKVSAIKQVGLFEENLRYTMDYQYWLRLWQTIGAPLVVSETLAAFRIHIASKGGSQFLKQFDEELNVARTVSQQPILLFLHRLHNAMIKAVYSRIK